MRLISVTTKINPPASSLGSSSILNKDQETAGQNSGQILPSRFDMIKNLAQAAKDAIASGLEVRSPEDVEKALNICAVCPKLINDDGWFRCGACGCGIGYAKPDRPNELAQPAKLGKLAMKAWRCPLGKW